MSVSVRVRFEVFKRDRFACSYCGNHPPDVLLEVDHVIPRAAGGTDEMENLVTACWDCNRGKSDRLLDEGDRPAVSPKTVAAMQERLEQAKAYVELLSQLSGVTDAMHDHIIDYWAKAFDARVEERDGGAVWVLPGGAWPNHATLRQFLRELDMDQILGAVDAAASKVGANRGNDRYFYAICWRLIRDRRSADVVPTDDETTALRLRLLTLEDELAERDETIADLRKTIRRFREETGRE